RALLAQGEADAYKGALLLSRVDNFRLDWEAPTVKPIEATPVYARLMDRRASFDRDLRLIRDLPETPGGEGACARRTGPRSPSLGPRATRRPSAWPCAGSRTVGCVGTAKTPPRACAPSSPSPSRTADVPAA